MTHRTPGWYALLFLSLAAILAAVLLTGCLDFERLSEGRVTVSPGTPDAGTVTGYASTIEVFARLPDAGRDLALPIDLAVQPADMTTGWPGDLVIPPDFPPNFQFSTTSDGMAGATCLSHAECNGRYCHLNVCTLHPNGTPSGPNGSLSCESGYHEAHLYACAVGTCLIYVCGDPGDGG